MCNEKLCSYCNELLLEGEDGIHDGCVDYLNFWDIYDADELESDD